MGQWPIRKLHLWARAKALSTAQTKPREQYYRSMQWNSAQDASHATAATEQRESQLYTTENPVRVKLRVQHEVLLGTHNACCQRCHQCRKRLEDSKLCTSEVERH
jgi:hypothetical protein